MGRVSSWCSLLMGATTSGSVNATWHKVGSGGCSPGQCTSRCKAVFILCCVQRAACKSLHPITQALTTQTLPLPLLPDVVEDYDAGLEYATAQAVLDVVQVGTERRFKVQWSDGYPVSGCRLLGAGAATW